VIVLGAACGQYPGVHSESVANQQPAVATAPQPPSSPVSGVESDPSSTTSTTTTTAKKSHADGAQGPGKDAVQGGGQSVDLSRVFAVNHARKDGAGKHASGTGDTKTGSSSGPKQGSTDSKSGTNSAKTSTSSKSSKGTSKTAKGISGDDGAKPGKPDIKGKITPGQVPTGGSLDLATVISHETVAGAKYNSTILPKGFPMFICPVQGRYSYSDSYGAPRYAGGYHPHAGVDIFADQGTPIVAPFVPAITRS